MPRKEKGRGTARFALIAAVVVGVVACVALWLASHYQATSAERLEDRYGIEMPAAPAQQQDILAGALDYISDHPKYKSAYYEGGYPDDGYSVCTDLVAAGLLFSGYDLRELVDADIRQAPREYGIEEPDPNIDYRRVRNLRVFLERNGESLTTDITDADAWQGGDIVVFQDHIGVVSDRRNERGVPYVIHHDGPFQPSYEQDILESRSDLTGHYRFPSAEVGK